MNKITKNIVMCLSFFAINTIFAGAITFGEDGTMHRVFEAAPPQQTVPQIQREDVVPPNKKIFVGRLKGQIEVTAERNQNIRVMRGRPVSSSKTLYNSVTWLYTNGKTEVNIIGNIEHLSDSDLKDIAPVISGISSDTALSTVIQQGAFYTNYTKLIPMMRVSIEVIINGARIKTFSSNPKNPIPVGQVFKIMGAADECDRSDKTFTEALAEFEHARVISFEDMIAHCESTM